MQNIPRLTFSPQSCLRPSISPRRRLSARRMYASTDASSGAEAIQRALSGVVGGQLTAGGVAGYATGFAVRQIGRFLLVILGVEVVLMQVMAQRKWISVDWDKIHADIAPYIDTRSIDTFLDSAKLQMPFAGAFSAGCIAGLRWP